MSPILISAVVLCLCLLSALLALFLQLRKARKRLQHDEQSHNAFFDASPDMIFMLEGQGKVRLANSAARLRLFADGEAHKLGDFLDPEGQRRLKRVLDLARHQAVQESLYFFPKSGDPLHIDITAFPLWGKHDAEPGICCMARDMTYRLKMESELVEAERLVVIGKMAAGIAHEVNNPLHIILTNAELMRELTSDPELLPCIQAIIHSSERAASIIRQLLDLSSPAPTMLATLDLAALVRASLLFLKPRLKDVQVDISQLPETLPLHGDKAQLEQLLLNLFLNALTSMDGKGAIAVSAEFNAAEQWVRLKIRDSGKGIPQENMEKIFDLFFTTRNREGFGLGLFLCRRIAERHSGRLYAESELGRGATFIVELPTAKAHLL